jgi:exodeoxyribonuclease VII small subunit
VSKAGKATSAEAALPFEEALKKLESIVEAMETTDLPLEQLLERFEEGTRLAQASQGQLDLAEVRVQKLEKSLGGRNEPQPLTGADGDLAD